MTDFHDEVAGEIEASKRPPDRLDRESAQIVRAISAYGIGTPEELSKLTGLPLCLVLHRLRLLETAGIVERRDERVVLPLYDGEAINARWDYSWPTGNDPTDPGHEHSPVLQAPVANQLGRPWYLESESPGGDYVTWLDLPDGRRVGVSPHLAGDGYMRWMIGILDQHGRSTHHEHELLITARPEHVVARIHAVMAEHDINLP
ncbi:hypothetical protein [Actinoplanes sp. NPDC023714]|uniref:hypothetical protein n=1 Tax=Actinoplanes sp. NPDC023714 TaxID=3154322 RepID=UPI0033F86B79